MFSREVQIHRDLQPAACEVYAVTKSCNRLTGAHVIRAPSRSLVVTVYAYGVIMSHQSVMLTPQVAGLTVEIDA